MFHVKRRGIYQRMVPLNISFTGALPRAPVACPGWADTSSRCGADPPAAGRMGTQRGSASVPGACPWGLPGTGCPLCRLQRHCLCGSGAGHVSGGAYPASSPVPYSRTSPTPDIYQRGLHPRTPGDFCTHKSHQKALGRPQAPFLGPIGHLQRSTAQPLNPPNPPGI